MVSGSVLFSGRKGCIDQEDDVLFLPLPPCCRMQSHKYTRGKRKTFQSFTGQPQRHSTRQKQRQSEHSFVTANNETTASVRIITATTTLTDVFIKFIYSLEPSDEPIYLALCVSVVLMTKSTFCVQNHRSFNTPCIRVLKFSAGASCYSEVQPEQAEAKRRTR